MTRKLQNTLNASVRRLLHPLVRILLRNGVAYGTLAGLIRQVYVDVAFKEFAPQGKKQTVSRVSALTGLTRKEVKRLLEETQEEGGGQARYSRAVRVISGWLHDERFLGENGRPAVLPVDGAQPSFSLLVKEYSGDIPTKAMLSMLEEGGTVSVSRDQRVRLLRHAYVPGGDSIEKIRILGSDVYELISTIDHNLTASPDELWYQRKVSYDNIDPAAVGKLRKMSFTKAQALLEQLDRQYSRHDAGEDVADGGKYISLGIYFYEQDSEDS